MEHEEIKKILSVLALAKSAVSLGYISLYTRIKEPIEILEEMEKRGLVSKRLSTDWSYCMDPMFEITPIARKELLTNIVGCADSESFNRV